MSKIYIATKEVSYVFGAISTQYDHLYLVYDPDDNPSNNNEYIIRGGPSSPLPSSTSGSTLIWDEIVIEESQIIEDSKDDFGAFETPYTRHYTTLDLNGLQADVVWAVMTAHAEAINDAGINYTLTFDVGFDYVVSAVNSNSVVSSVVTEALGIGSMTSRLPNDPNANWVGLGASLVDAPSGGYEIDGYYYLLGNDQNNNIAGANVSHKYVIDGGNGADNIAGNSGNDFLYGGANTDELTGGAGTDYLNGGSGTDTAIFSGNYAEYSIVGGTGSMIVTDTVTNRDGTDTLVNIERIEFADRIYENGVSRPKFALLKPVTDDDTAVAAVNGSVNINVLGNDYDPDNQAMTISLGTQAAHGTATLQTNGTFTYVPHTNFSGVDSFTYTLTDIDNLTTIATVNVAVGSSVIYGTSGNDSLLSGTSSADIIVGLAGNDGIDGAGGHDIIHGDAGVDVIFGNSGNDEIYGGDGSDSLEGGAGNDTIKGGAGNDNFFGNDGATESLFGGTGADNYYFDMAADTGWVGVNESDSQGSDTIYLDNTTSGDRIEFEYSSGQLNASYYATALGGATFSFSISTTNALTGKGVEYIVIDDKIYSTKNIIAAADAATNNTFIFDIEEYESTGYPSQLSDGTSATAYPVQSSSYGYGIYADYSSSSSFYTLRYASEAFHAVIADGSAPPPDNSTMGSGASAIMYIKNFLLDPGFSADNVRLTVNNNDNAGINIHLDDVGVTYSYSYFEEGFFVTGYSVSSGSYSNIGTVVGNSSSSITIYGEDVAFDSSASHHYYFENIIFANGDVINLLGVVDFEGTAAGDTLYGIDRADVIHGYAGDDNISSGAGDDTIYGGEGTDTITGATGNDVYVWNLGDGTDYLSEQTGLVTDIDEIHLGAGITVEDVRFFRSGSVLEVHAGGEILYLNYHFYNEVYGSEYDSYRFEKLVFADGTEISLLDNVTFTGTSTGEAVNGTNSNDTLIGLEGGDNLLGNAGNDTLIGGEGNDSIDGSEGNDVYVWNLGDGTDYLSEQSGLLTDVDEIRLGSGITAEDVRLIRNSSVLEIHIGSEVQYLNYHFTDELYGSGYENYKFEKIVFANLDEINLLGDLTFTGTSSGESLSGTSHNDTIVGLDGNDAISGDAGDDTLTGGAGNDSINGSEGNDLYVWNLGDGTDYLSEQSGLLTDVDEIRLGAGIAAEDIRLVRNSSVLEIHIGSEVQYLNYHFTDELYGSGYENYKFEKIVFANLDEINLLGDLTFTGTSSGESLSGTSHNDTIVGLDGNDAIFGFVGNDTLIGGEGNDSIYGYEGNDVYLWNLGDGTDYLSEQNGLSTDIDEIHLGIGISTEDVRLVRNTYGLELHIGSEVQYLNHHFYDEVYGSGYEGYKFEKIVFANLSEINLLGDLTFTGTSSGETLSGTSHNDTVVGLDGNDTLYGYAGNDLLYGGSGSDILYGGDNNDTLDGGADNDTINGEAGTDTVSYLTASAAVTVSLAVTSAQATGGSGTDTITNTENLTGSIYGDLLIGDSGNNVINGDAGDDVIEGNVGNDTLTGGSGTDTLTYTATGTGVTVNLATTTGQNTVGAGTDTISGFENLRGSAYNDALTGDGNANVIEGGAGNDTINGAGGIDTLTYIGATAAVTVNLATTTAQNTAGAGTDTISNFENLTGSIYNDTLTGNTAANIIEGGDGNDTISGGDGNDTLNGGAGNDTLTGGNGTDTITYIGATSAVTVNLATATGQNTGGAGTDTIATVENLIGSIYNDILTGTTAANVISGGAGNDTISGGDGNDTLNGGDGNDTLTGGNGTDTVTYIDAVSAVTVNLATATAQNTVGAGTDTLATIENLTGSAYNDTLTGNSSANTIAGGDGNDTVEGAAGNDTLTGGNGTDTVSYASAGSAVTFNLSTTTSQATGGAGSDTVSGFENVTGSAFNDTLTGDGNANVIKGGSGNDTLSGGAGNDILYGEAGTDAMTGGLNADIFVFEAASAYSNIDTVSDFSTAQGDALNIANLLGEYDALTEAITDFVLSATSGSNTTISVDRDGTGSTYGFTQIATLTGVTGLTDEVALVTNGNMIVV